MEKLILDEIKKVIADYEARSETRSRWKEPLLGFASCEDETFELLKKVANPLHLSPFEAAQPDSNRTQFHQVHIRHKYIYVLYRCFI